MFLHIFEPVSCWINSLSALKKSCGHIIEISFSIYLKIQLLVFLVFCIHIKLSLQ